MLLTRPEGPEAADLHFNRRSFAALVLAGYAAAGAAAEAAPVTTPADGLTIEMPVLPGGLPAYVARPAGTGRHPVVIVVNEVFGLHEYIKDVCRRFARLGYVAVAPEFFYRADPQNTLATLTDFPAIIKIVNTAGNEQVMGDVKDDARLAGGTAVSRQPSTSASPVSAGAAASSGWRRRGSRS